MVRFCYGSKPLCPSCRQESHPTRVRGVHRDGSETAQNDLLQHQTKVAHLQDGHCAQNRVSMSLLCLFAGRANGQAAEQDFQHHKFQLIQEGHTKHQGKNTIILSCLRLSMPQYQNTIYGGKQIKGLSYEWNLINWKS